MNALSIPGAAVWLGWLDTLLILSLQATLLAALVWVVIKLLGRWIPPSWRALLWFVVIARVLIPVAPPSPFSLQNVFVKPVAAKPAAAPPARIEFPENSREVDLQTTRGIINSTVFRAPEAVLPRPVHREINPAKALGIVWASGAILLLALLIARSLIIRARLVRDGRAPKAEILEAIEECRVQLGLRMPIRVTVSDRIAAPALTGLIPARLILPSSFNAVEFADGQFEEAREDARPPSLTTRQVISLGEFTSAQVRQILLHELAHIKQGHLFLHWIALIARAVHWFNPAIHFAAAGLRQECELAADAAALKNSNSQERAAYGETILQVLSHTTAPPTLLAMGMADRARHLEQRLRALNRPNRRRYHLAGVIALVAMCLAGLSGAQTQTPNQANLGADKTGASNRPVSVNTVPAIVAANNARLSEPSQTTNRVPVLGDIPIVGRLFESAGNTNAIKTATPSGNVDAPRDERVRGTVIRDARSLIEAGRFDEAEMLLQEYSTAEPADRNTLDYLSLKRPRVVAQADAEKSTVDQFAQSKAKLIERDKLLRKIDTVRIDDLPLTTPVDLLEVVKELNFQTRKRDPDHQGVNFVLDKASIRAANLNVDLDRFKIKIDPPVRDVTLRQLCEVIVRVATPPPDSPESATLEYAVADYGIIFTARPRDLDQYKTRSFKVNPNIFQQGLDAVLPRIVGTKVNDIPAQVRAYFELAGVDFSSTNKAIFYNDRAGILFARATPAELDVIEHAVHTINIATEVSIAVEVFDLSHEEGMRLQKQWDNQSPSTATNEFLFVSSKQSTEKPTLLFSKILLERIPDPVIAADVTVPGVQSIIPRSKAQSFSKTLKSTKGVNEVTMPNVTTVVGRGARISIEEAQTVVTAGTTSVGGAPLSLGWAFDCFPHSFDGAAVELECGAGETEFLGYDKVGDTPFPTFHVRAMGCRAKIPAGASQAFLMPALRVKGVPVARDIPNLRTLLKAQSDSCRFVLILITPTIIDAAGNIVVPKQE